MRIPYAPSEPDSSNAEEVEIYRRISARRVPRPLIPLDLALLHAPPVADGYNHFIGALRTRTSISPALLEMSICRVGILNKAVYEWNIHGPLALKAGVTVEELNDVQALPPFTDNGLHSRQAWADTALSETQQAVIKYTDEMTNNVAVGDEIFDQVSRALSEREVVELTAAIAGYNCVSRFLVALNVGEHNGEESRTPEQMSSF